MKYHKLRIAWSVAWGVVAVLLCVLWVRSYSIADVFYHASNSGTSSLRMTTGILSMSHAEAKLPSDTDGWDYISAKPTQFRRSTLFYFHLKWSASRQIIEVPVWLPALFLFIIAAAPWLPLNRFSLRTLLIATTLVAVGLELIVRLM
jgi:hypothetical protein